MKRKNQNTSFMVLLGLCLSAGVFSQQSHGGLLPELHQIVGGIPVENRDPIAATTVGFLSTSANGRVSICTGSVIASDLVVTAGHCVGPEKSNIRVVFYNQLSVSSPSVPILNYVRHSRYGEGVNDQDNYDIALVRLAAKVPSGIRPVSLVENQAELYDGREVVLAGYGVYDGYGGGDGGGTLRKTKVTIHQARYGQTEILMDQSQGYGACRGDSGGPALIQKDGQYYLFGVTSRGPSDKPDHCDTVGIYTNLLAHQEFLKEAKARLYGPNSSAPQR